MLAPQDFLDFSRQINVTEPVSPISAVMVLLATCLDSLRHVENTDKSVIENYPLMTVQDHGFDKLAHKDVNRSVAEELAKKVRVLCMVMTQTRNHDNMARHVKATWGKRCNKLLFMSTTNNENLPTIKAPPAQIIMVWLPVAEVAKGSEWAKTKEAFKYVYENHKEDADWFMMVDDNTYVVVENLRYMLSEHKSTDPVYFACRFKSFTPQGYLTGGAGFILNKRALRRFVEYGLSSPHLCEDSELGAKNAMGICLKHIGVKALDSRDSFGRDRFFPFMPRSHLFPKKYDKRFWHWKYMYNPSDEGLECCSDHSVLLHDVNAEDMYLIDYFIYHLRPYGVRYGVDTKRKKGKKNKHQVTVAQLPLVGY